MTTTETSRYRGYDILPASVVTVVRQRLPYALRSAHFVAIHSEKSDATKERCPGGCQETHRPHSDADQSHHLVRFSLAPLELASLRRGTIFLSGFNPVVRVLPQTSAIHSSAPKESPANGPGFPPV
jgi:hypothetical protein